MTDERERRNFAFLRAGRPIHKVYETRIASIQTVRSLCGYVLRNAVTSWVPPQLDPYECWITGWFPCSRCFPDFDLAKWRVIRNSEDAALEADGGDPEGRAYAAFYDGMWREIEKRRAENVA
jgi:hypothetical protein